MGRFFYLSWIGSSFLFLGIATGSVPHAALTIDGLKVDGHVAPYLLGAEVQYFRARGGSGRNVPAAVVHKLWNKMLDRVHEAKMNAVIFYIPWDFHEPAEGVFDFDGTLDQDGDGHPDYPSRNLKYFLSLVEAHGIKYVMLRPGPYINAEWGPEGFGAIPKWFLEKYPGALAVTQTPGKPRTASFHHPLYLDRVEKWFRAVYKNVLQSEIGAGKPTVFFQLDNETNYFWDSVYERDWHERSLARYRDFLRTRYQGKIALLNTAYGSDLNGFDRAEGPRHAADVRYPNPAWHYDWYEFHDREILEYHKLLRALWEKIGVHEPDVIFTTCDSFNAAPGGILPRLDYRQTNQLSLTTMNIYPKTFGTAEQSTLNEPMKAAHDATLVSTSLRQMYGLPTEWLMSSETMGGWFPPTEVTLAARQHTYGSLIASGVKAMIIYYFHEGWNWSGNEENDSELRFDAPLDKEMNPRPAFALLKNLGNALERGLGKVALESRREKADILVAHDSGAQYPSIPGVDAVKKASTDSAGLFGHLREAGYSPDVAFLDRLTEKELISYRAIFWDHPGYLPPASRSQLQKFLTAGGTLITIGDSGLQTGARAKVIVLDRNPGMGWNQDTYVTLPKAGAALEGTRALLKAAGAAPQVEVLTSDGKPFLHAWLRPTKAGALVAVENFLPSSRNFRLKLPRLAAGRNYRWHKLWGATLESPVVTLTGAQLLNEGIPLTIPANSVDLWNVEIQ